MAASVSASILLKDKAGFRFKDDGGDPRQCTVAKGELVIELPKEEIPPIESDKPPPNYRVYRDDEYVVLNCGTMDVCPLIGKEMEYLLAVEPLSTRLQEYLKPEEAKKKLDLVVGNTVMFKLKLKSDATAYVKGIIRYIGPIEEKFGTHFGIEIQEQRYRGKGTSNGDPYFRCGSKDAVFLSIDKITKKSQYPIDEKKPAATNATITCDQTSRDPTSTSNVKGKLEAIEVQGTRADPNHRSKFKINDRVVVKSAKDEVFNGTVKWVGTTRVRNQGDRYSSVVAAVGVDVDKKIISIDKHFPGMYLEFTGSRGQELFKVPFSHTRLYFPEEYGIVLHAEEYAKQQQEANALKWEMKEAKKFDLSLEEYRSQKEYMERAKKDKKTNPKQTGGGQEEEGAVAGVGAFNINESEKDKMSESMMHIKPGEPLSEGRRQKEERAYELARQQSQHGGSDPAEYEVINGGEVNPVDNNYLDVRPYHTVPEDHQQDASTVPEGLRSLNFPAGYHDYCHHRYPPCSSANWYSSRSSNQYYGGSNQYPPGGSHGGSSDNYQPGGSSNQYSSGGPPPDPHHQFTIGSMVRIDTQKGDPLYGVVQWIGTLPDYPGTIAGVEMEKPLQGCTDGTWHGRRFFTCPPGRGYFCPVTALRQDTRYMDEGQVPAHMRQHTDNRSNKEEMIKLKEEIHQLQMSIENFQLEKDTQQRRAQQQEQQWRNEKQQLLEEQERLREEIKQVQEQIETDKERIREENDHLKYENGQLKYEIGQLQYENEDLRRQVTDLREVHHELQQETEKKEQVQAQLQSQVGLFSIENMRLKGQVKQLEESSATDIKYWEVSYKQVLTNKDTLGSGGWGKVEVGLLHGQKVAVKMLHSDIKSPYYNQLVRREISMLAKVRHPNLLLFITGVLDHPSGSPIIITELLDMSLRKAYTDHLIGSDRVRISIMRDVAAALNYIHRQKESIIHRDVSSANVLLESRGEGNWKAKLSDFGSANLVQFSTTVGPGAIPYAAPEVPHSQTTKMDVYSYGVLLCEVMLSEFPFKERFPDMLQSLAGSWSLMHQLILSCTRHSVTDRVDMMYVLDTFNESFTDVSVKGFVPLV